jgi:hypothetical protein
MHEQALFIRSGKNINRLQKMDFISTPVLKATDSFPAITVLTVFDLKLSLHLQCMHFGFLFFICSMNSSDLTYRNPTAFSHSPCHSRGFNIIGGRAFLGAFAKLRKATISFLMSVLLSVHMEQLRSHWTDFHEI